MMNKIKAAYVWLNGPYGRWVLDAAVGFPNMGVVFYVFYRFFH